MQIKYEKHYQPRALGCLGCVFNNGKVCNLPSRMESTCGKDAYVWKEVKVMKSPKLTQQQTVSKVLAGFDFERVNKVMKALNWAWYGSCTEDKIPTYGELLVSAQDQLNRAYEGLLNDKETNSFTTGTGGFEATAHRYAEHNEIWLELRFVVADNNCSNQDNSY